MPNPRSFRVSNDDMEMMRALQEHFPYRFENISKVHREALRRGLLSLAAEANSPDLPGQWGGLRLAPLLAALRAAFGPMMAFLGTEMPAAPLQPLQVPDAMREPEPEAAADAPMFDTQVVRNLQQLGTGFDDDDLEG